MKKWYKSRTIQIAVLMGISGVITALTTQYPTIGWLITGKAFLDVVLRFISTTELK